MSITKSSTIFFEKMERTYENVLSSMTKLIEHGEPVHSAHLEVNFVLRIITELRISFNQNSIVTNEILEEILKGAYLRFEDNGEFYNKLVHLFHINLQKRRSSHHSYVQQYSFSGPIVKEILFGVSKDEKGTKTTWIQFERHDTNTPVNLILHLGDYFIYKWTGKNIGPYGSSNYTESNPLVVSF
jgi:hypothetical protein